MILSRIIHFTVATLLLLTVPALAFDPDRYITYGGFSVLHPAFQQCAAIFNSTDFSGMATGIAIFGIMLTALAKTLTTERPSPLSWVFMATIGISIYTGMFIPRTDLIIYDPVYNQEQVVADLPLGVDISSKISNYIEQFAVETIDMTAAGTTTACGVMPPLQYQTSGGSVAPALLAATANSTLQNAVQSQYLMNYMNVCWTFEIGRPGTTSSNDNLLSPGCGVTMLDVLATAQNPAVFVTNPQTNLSVSCTQAYTDISAFYNNPLNAGAAALNACGGSDFSDMAQCQGLIQSITNSTLGLNIDPNSFILQQTLANLSTMALISGDSSSVQQIAQIQQSNANSGVMSSVSNPQLINTYLACIIIMFPFIVVLMVTGQLWRQAFSLVLSFLFFIAILRVLDVVCFRLWAHHYQNAMASAYNNEGLGAAVSMTLNAKISGMLNTLGYMRSSIATIATVVSGVLFRFSDQGIARMGARLEAKAEKQEQEFKDPGMASLQDQKQAGAREAMVAAIASGAHGMQNYAIAEEGRIAGDTGSSMGARDAAGGTSGGVASSARQTSGIDQAKRGGGASMQTTEQAYDSSQAGVQQESNLAAQGGMPFHATENMQSGLTNITGPAGNISAKDDTVMDVKGSAGSGMKLEETARQENSRTLSNAEQMRDEKAQSYTQDTALTKTNADGTTSVEKNGETLTYSKESARVVESAQRSAIQDALRNGATITDEKGNSVDQSLFAGATAKGGFTVFGNGIDASGGYKADVRTADGHRYSVNMSGDQAKTFENSYADRMSQSDKTGKSHALSYDDSNSRRAETAASATQRKADNYTHAASRVQEISDRITESKAKSNQMGVNQETQFAKWWADKYQGGQGVQETMNALEEMKLMETDPAQTGEFQKRQNEFLQETGQIVTSGQVGQNVPAPINTATTIDGLQQNLRHGDHEAIKADDRQLTAMGAIVDKSPEQLKAESPEQFNQDAMQAKAEFIKPGSDATATIDKALHSAPAAIPAHLPGFPSDISGTVGDSINKGSTSISSGAHEIDSPTHVPSNIRETVQHTNPPKVVTGGHVTNAEEIGKGRTNINNAGKNLSVTPMGAVADKILTPLGQGEAPSAQGVIDGKQYSGMSSEERLARNIAGIPGTVATAAGAVASAAFPIANGKPIDGAQVIKETVRGNMGLQPEPVPGNDQQKTPALLSSHQTPADSNPAPSNSTTSVGPAPKLGLDVVPTMSSPKESNTVPASAPPVATVDQAATAPAEVARTQEPLPVAAAPVIQSTPEASASPVASTVQQIPEQTAAKQVMDPQPVVTESAIVPGTPASAPSVATVDQAVTSPGEVAGTPEATAPPVATAQPEQTAAPQVVEPQQIASPSPVAPGSPASAQPVATVVQTVTAPGEALTTSAVTTAQPVPEQPVTAAPQVVEPQQIVSPSPIAPGTPASAPSVATVDQPTTVPADVARTQEPLPIATAPVTSSTPEATATHVATAQPFQEQTAAKQVVDPQPVVTESPVAPGSPASAPPVATVVQTVTSPSEVAGTPVISSTPEATATNVATAQPVPEQPVTAAQVADPQQVVSPSPVAPGTPAPAPPVATVDQAATAPTETRTQEPLPVASAPVIQSSPEVQASPVASTVQPVPEQTAAKQVVDSQPVVTESAIAPGSPASAPPVATVDQAVTAPTETRTQEPLPVASAPVISSPPEAQVSPVASTVQPVPEQTADKQVVEPQLYQEPVVQPPILETPVEASPTITGSAATPKAPPQFDPSLFDPTANLQSGPPSSSSSLNPASNTPTVVPGTQPQISPNSGDAKPGINQVSSPGATLRPGQ